MKMTEDDRAAKLKRDEETRRWHEAAVASGEKRILSRTSKATNYELHSYLPDEIGFSRQGSGVVVTSTWGMFVLAGLMVLGFVFSIVMMFAAAASGKDWWGGLFPLVISGFGAWAGFHYAMEDVKAKKIRRERGVPDPSPNQTSH